MSFKSADFYYEVVLNGVVHVLLQSFALPSYRYVPYYIRHVEPSDLEINNKKCEYQLSITIIFIHTRLAIDQGIF